MQFIWKSIGLSSSLWKTPILLLWTFKTSLRITTSLCTVKIQRWQAWSKICTWSINWWKMKIVLSTCKAFKQLMRLGFLTFWQLIISAISQTKENHPISWSRSWLMPQTFIRKFWHIFLIVLMFPMRYWLQSYSIWVTNCWLAWSKTISKWRARL